MTDSETRWWCGARLMLSSDTSGRVTASYDGRGQAVTVLTCVEHPDHDPSIAHKSGTDPVFRWRTSAEDPNAIDVWTEPWRDWAGRTVSEREAVGLP